MKKRDVASSLTKREIPVVSNHRVTYARTSRTGASYTLKVKKP